MDAGKVVLELHGQKLGGLWELVRIAKAGDRQIAWILFKKHDAWERSKSEYDKAVYRRNVERPLIDLSWPLWQDLRNGHYEKISVMRSSGLA